MISFLKKQKLRVKVLLLGSGSVLITALVLVLLAVWQSGQYNKLAQSEVDELTHADLDHITQAVYSLVETEHIAIMQQVNYNLNVMRHVLRQAGGLHFSSESASWDAANQFTHETIRIHLPKVLVGSSWLGQNTDPAVETPVVDEVAKLVGDTATIFQRMNRNGDMLRIATSVKTAEGKRAVGTFIPAVNPDGQPNPVISAVLKGKTFQGRAFVVNAWNLTSYEPIRDGSGDIIGMIYGGVKQEKIEIRLRAPIIQTKVGKTGYIYVLRGKGEGRGHYIISQGGKRDGENVWETVDPDGHKIIQDIIRKAVSLPSGQMATVRYRWLNAGESAPRWKEVRIAYFEPWDWVIGTGAYEDELQRYRLVLSSGRMRMTSIMGIAGLAITLIIGLLGALLAWTIARPLQKMTEDVKNIIPMDLSQKVDLRGKDEIGVLAATFDFMTGELQRTMEEMRQSEEKYRSIFENALEGIFQTTFDGRVWNANPAMARMLEYDSPEELISRLTDLRNQFYVHPEDRDALVSSILSQGWVFGREVQAYCRNGRKIWVSVSVRKIVNEAGRPLFLEGFMTDITQRKESEKELRLAHQRLLDIIEFLPDATFVIDNEKKVIAWNRALEKMTGVPKESIIGKGDYAYSIPFWGKRQPIIVDLIGVEARETEALYKHIERRFDTLYAEVFVPSLYGGKGAYVSVTASPLLDAAGNRYGAIESVRDITERIQAEEALRTSEARMQLYFQQTLLGIIGWDTEFRVERWNLAAEKTFGYTAEEAIGRHASFLVPDYARPLLEQIKKELWAGTGGQRSRNENISKSGQTITCEWHNALLKDAHGKIVGAASLVQDVTHEAELEHQLRISQKREALGTLAGGIAHDFNNILGGILGYADLSRSYLDKDHPVYEFQEQIFSASQRAKELVQQILTVARQQEKEKLPVEIHLIVKEVVQLIRKVTPSTIDIRLDVDSRSGKVMADPAQIHQILMNLCTNAIHAMRNHEGVLTIRLCRVDLDIQHCSTALGLKPGEFLRLEVADTGHGMSEAILERIFDPYFTTKGLGEGTGLGLAVVKGIVDSHEGTIIATSEEGKGSLFVVYLPRYSEAAPLTPGTHEQNVKGTERILLVDDEPQLTSVGKAMLEHLGYTVTTCNQSPEALKLFRSQPDKYDVVITDQTMPVLTGVHLAMEILAIRPEMPIVLCTGYSDQVDKNAAEKMGIAEFIAKPLSMKIMGEMIQNAVKRKRP